MRCRLRSGRDAKRYGRIAGRFEAGILADDESHGRAISDSMEVAIGPWDNKWRCDRMHPPLRLQNPFSHCHASIQRTVFTFVPWLVCTGSWTQQEFLLSGQTAPVTPDGVPLSEHASFLPPEDSFALDVDELRSQLPRSSSSSARGKPVALRVATTSSEWHVFGGGVPLVRQHSQGASRRGSSPVPSLLFPRRHIKPVNLAHAALCAGSDRTSDRTRSSSCRTPVHGADGFR